MKLVISYDLPERIKEANTGFSLKKTSKKVLFYTGINTVIGSTINLSTGQPIEKYFFDILVYLGLHSSINGLTSLIAADLQKKIACCDLAILTHQLRDLNVHTDLDSLLKAYTYKTEYSVDLKDGIEQRKYINVPVCDAFGERETSLLQEHFVGSKEYVLSVGAPEEKKVYSLGMRKVMQK